MVILKHVENQTMEDAHWRLNIRREEASNAEWDHKWHWMLKEYHELHEKTQEVSKKSEFLSEVNKDNRVPDLRTIKPVPVNTNGQYGWIANRPDFQLRYGTDLTEPLKMPKTYRLVY